VQLNTVLHKAVIELEKSTQLTVQQLFDRYMSEHVKPNLSARTAYDYNKDISKHILPAWGDRAAASITQRDAVDLLQAMVNRGQNIESEHIRANMSGMWGFAYNRGLIETMPFYKLPKVVAVNKNKRQKKLTKRALRENEIYYMWHGVDQFCTPQVAAVLKLMLLLGRRGEDIRPSLKTSFELDKALWHMIPGKLRESKKHLLDPITVPLPPLALGIIKAQFERSTSTLNPYLFPSASIKRIGSHMTQSALSQPVNDNEFGIPNWTPHDLRRTASTGFASLGFTQEQIDNVLAHGMYGLAKVYNLHDYVDLRKKVLYTWDAKIQKIIYGPAPKLD
jgi:integrase